MDSLKNFVIENKFKLVKILLSLFSIYGIISYFEIICDLSNLTNSFMNVILFIIMYIIYSTIKKLEDNEKFFTITFSILLGIILIIGAQLEFYSEIIWSFTTMLKIFSITLAIYPVINIIINSLKNYNLKKNINTNNYVKTFIIIFAIIFFFNFLVYLAIFPGVYGYDAGFEIMEVLEDDVTLTSKFSLPFCFFLAKLVNLGYTLFGSYEIGFSIYSFLQMTFLVFVATKITLFTIKKSKNIFLTTFSVLFFSFFPLFTVMSLSSAQDPIFAGIFALIILDLIDLTTNENYWKKIYKPIILSLLILLLCLFRNNGLYAIIVSLPLILIFSKTKRIITLTLFIIPSIFYLIYNGPIQNYMHIEQSNSIGEMLSIPSQQIARVYNSNPSIFTDNELQSLEKYYPTYKENFKHYIDGPSIADSTKGSINSNYVKKNKLEYFKFWLKLGIKDPKNYIEAFLMNSLGIWYPNKNYYDSRMYHPYLEYNMLDAKKYNPKYISINRKSKFELYEKILNSTIVDNTWKNLPIISTLFTAGTYFVLFIFLICLIGIRKNYKLLVSLSPIIGLYITILLAPVSLFRYCFPIVILLPVFIILIIDKDSFYK